MGDPTGLSGIVVSRLVDFLIQETKTTKQCQENCRALNGCLQTIRPLVFSVARDLSANEDAVAVAGLGPVKKWLEDLKNLLLEAGKLVVECQKTVKGWNLMRRNEFSKKILNAKQKIEDICTAEATLASLNIEVGTARGVDETLKVLAQLPLDVGNAVEEKFQPFREESDRAFREIKDQLDRLAATLSDPTSSSQQIYHEAEIRPATGKSFGVDGPLEKLRDLLLDEVKYTKYVGICGTGGIGKTRLAELAYNSNEVRDQFERRFWLTVGNDKSIEVLLRQLAEKLHVKTEYLKPDEIKTELFNALRETKVLLVLDDIWDNGDPVLEMLDVTSGPDTGSKILVTTRHIKVLETKGAQQSTVRMKGLSGDDSWGLFREFAFKGVDQVPHEVEKLAKDISAECKGLPLALKVVAGALAGKESPQEWRRALKRLEEAKILDRSHETQLYNRLQLSYDELAFVENDRPHRLQKCFIYFAGFPEDSDVDSEKLVNLWAGEKLLEAEDDTDDDIDPLEDGFSLLRELIGRSLIELRKEKWSDNSRRVMCRVHDVLRDFVRHLIREKRAPMDCLFGPGKGHKEFPHEWLKTPRSGGHLSDATHLSLNNNRLQSLPDKLNAPTLEVLLLSNNYCPLVIPPGFLENFSSLKVLDLQRTGIHSLPETLGNLTNLTYLELSETGLRKLPRGLCNLTKLEYLGLAGCAEMEPFAIECLKNLSTLDTGGCKKVWQGPTTEFELDALHNLCSLTNLRHLSIQGIREHLPSQMSQLVRLRHLAVSFKTLERLPEELHLEGGPKLSKLQYLHLIDCEELCELPSWVDSLSHIADLSFFRCLKLKSIPNLFKLQELHTLDLSHCSSLKQLPVGFASKGAFPALKVLHMRNCEALEEFPLTKEGPFPKLEILDMMGCKGLRQFCKGFASSVKFPALKELHLTDCVALEEFPPIKEGAFPKLQKLQMGNCTGLKNLGEGFASKRGFPDLKVKFYDRMLIETQRR